MVSTATFDIIIDGIISFQGDDGSSSSSTSEEDLSIGFSDNNDITSCVYISTVADDFASSSPDVFALLSNGVDISPKIQGDPVTVTFSFNINDDNLITAGSISDLSSLNSLRLSLPVNFYPPVLKLLPVETVSIVTVVDGEVSTTLTFSETYTTENSLTLVLSDATTFEADTDYVVAIGDIYTPVANKNYLF